MLWLLYIDEEKINGIASYSSFTVPGLITRRIKNEKKLPVTSVQHIKEKFDAQAINQSYKGNAKVCETQAR